VLLAPVVLVTSAVLLGQARALGSLLLGDEVAASQGVNVPRVRLIVLGASSLAVAAAVAWCGPIAFVVNLAPGVGGEGEMNRTMVIIACRQGGDDFYHELLTVAVGVAQEYAAQFRTQIANAVRPDLTKRLLPVAHHHLISCWWLAVQMGVSH
jgi:ABC-type enterobactin transport system permease subunit